MMRYSAPLRLQQSSNTSKRKKSVLAGLITSHLGKRGLAVMSTRNVLLLTTGSALANGSAVLVQALDSKADTDALTASYSALTIGDEAKAPSQEFSAQRSVSVLLWFDDNVAPNALVVDPETYRLLSGPSTERDAPCPPLARLAYLDAGAKPSTLSVSELAAIPTARSIYCTMEETTAALLRQRVDLSVDIRTELVRHIRWSAAGRLLCQGGWLVGVPFMGVLLNICIRGVNIRLSQRNAAMIADSDAAGVTGETRDGFQLDARTRIMLQTEPLRTCSVEGAPALHTEHACMERSLNGSAAHSIPEARLETSTHMLWDTLPGNAEARAILLRVASDLFRDAARDHVFRIEGILLCGPSGIGKTTLGQALARKLPAHLELLRCATLAGLGTRQIRHRFEEAIELSIMDAPSVLLIDDLDALLMRRDALDASEEVERTNAMLLRFFMDLRSHEKRLDIRLPDGSGAVLVVATVRERASMDRVLGSSGFFGLEVALRMPDHSERLEILQNLTSGSCPDASAVLPEVAEQTRGFTAADLTALWRHASFAAWSRRSATNSDADAVDASTGEAPHPSSADWREALVVTRPSFAPDWSLERPVTRWSDVGGQAYAKRVLQETLALLQGSAKALEARGFRLPRAILLYGPPGCSKTLLARAAAAESRLPMLMVRGPELFNKYVGESEKAVQRVFQRARAAAPSLLFFDEIDALATNRSRAASDGSTGAEERVLAQLLTELDGIDPLRDVVVLAATNRPDLLDEALLRPGRFDRLVYVALPETEEREHILAIHLGKVPLAMSMQTCGSDASTAAPATSRERLCAELAARTEGYSGAELAALVREACLLAMEENPANADCIQPYHLLEALQRVRPRTDPNLLRVYERFQATPRGQRSLSRLKASSR
jgi:SpoVK/Ycf46/Vps4 family AAA+-type ATPase